MDQTSWESTQVAPFRIFGCNWCHLGSTDNVCCCIKHPWTTRRVDGSMTCITEHPQLPHVYKMHSVMATLKMQNRDLPDDSVSDEKKNKFIWEEALRHLRSWLLSKSQDNSNMELPCCLDKILKKEYSFIFCCQSCKIGENNAPCCCVSHHLTKSLLHDNMSCITEHPEIQHLYKEDAVKARLEMSGKDLPEPNHSEERKRSFYRTVAKQNLECWIQPTEKLDAEKLPCCLNTLLDEEYPKLFKNNSGMFVVISQTEGREGAKQDVEKLKTLCKDIAFTWTLIENKTIDEIETQLLKSLGKVKSKDKCYICVIMAHGKEDHVLSDSNGKEYGLNTLTEIIGGKSYMKDISKLVFVQACRGTESKLVEDPGGKDFLLSFGTVYGQTAYRSIEGSYFIRCLDESFRECSGLDIMQVVATINNKLPEKKKKCAPSTTTWLTKEVRLTVSNNASIKRPEFYQTEREQNNVLLIIADQTLHKNDISNLKEIGSHWGFEIKIINCMRNQKVLSELESHAHSLKPPCCFICAIVSEPTGNRDKFDLKYRDETYNLSDVIKLFRFREMEEWPKLFLVQKFTETTRNSYDFADALTADQLVPDDFMITYSAAGKNINGSSIFYDTLLSVSVRNLNSKDEHYDLSTILRDVRAEMANMDQPVPWTRTQLRKLVRFSKRQEPILSHPQED